VLCTVGMCVDCSEISVCSFLVFQTGIMAYRVEVSWRWRDADRVRKTCCAMPVAQCRAEYLGMEVE
jgi:hypothetical protein